MSAILRNWIARSLVMSAWAMTEKSNSADTDKSFEALMTRLLEAWHRL